jgi:hypothetical protein
VYFSFLLLQAADNRQWSMLPFLVIFQIGFLYVGLMSLTQNSIRIFPRSQPGFTPASA